MKRDAAKPPLREEAPLCRAAEEVDHAGHMLRIWTVRNAERYPDVGSVHEHVGEVRSVAD
jgi:hypothetical protein